MSFAWFGTLYNGATCGVTLNSTAVTVAGTDLLAAGVGEVGFVGQGFQGPDRAVYEIASINSPTSLTLARNYLGSTVASGGTFGIAPYQGYTRDAAYQLAALIARATAISAVGAKNAADYNVVGDGTTDDGAALNAWLAAIPEGGSGYLPAASVYYKSTVALTVSGQVNIRGDGLASRIHYTGSGVALTLDSPRFSRLDNFYITGTVSAAGGVYVKGAQEGFLETSFFVDSFTGASAYAQRFSSCWTLAIVGGASRQSTTGLWFDNTNFSVAAVNNNINVFHTDCSDCTIGLDYMSGFAANFIGCDFSGCVTAIELARGIAGTLKVSSVNIIGGYIEGTNGIYIARSNTSSATPSQIKIAPSYFDATAICTKFYKGDLITVEESAWGAGTCTIDAGVTRTNWHTLKAVTDNSTAGQTTKVRNGAIEAAELYASATLILPTYVKTALPAVTAGRFIYVSNEAGGAVPAFSDGTNWRRVTDRAVVS